MSKVTKKLGFYLPKVGPQRALLARETYLGEQTNPRFPESGAREQTKIALQLEERGPDGKRLLFEETRTLSLADVAPLASLVDALVGGNANIKVGQEIDLQELIGLTCLVNIIHKPPDRKGRVWPKIASYMPLPAGMAPLELEPLPPEKPQPTNAAQQAMASTVAQTTTAQPTSSASLEPEPVKMPGPPPATSTWHYVPKTQANTNTTGGD
jgi:hypothetical protein